MDAFQYWETVCYPERGRLVGLAVTCPDGRIGVVTSSRWNESSRLELRLRPSDKPAPEVRRKDGTISPNGLYSLADMVEINGEHFWYILAEGCKVDVGAN